MKSKNIGIVIYSYYKDEDFLILCLNGLLHTIAKSPMYNVYVFVVDDNNMQTKINVKNLPIEKYKGKLHVIYTDWDRKGNLNGFDCMYGMVSTYYDLTHKFNLDYVLKFDSDCFLNTLDYIHETEQKLMEMNIPVSSLLQTGSSFCNICCQGCAQTMTRKAVYTLMSMFQNMKEEKSEASKILRKRITLGYYEDRVISLLLEMVPDGVRFDIKTLPGCLGHLNCFDNPNADFTKYTSLTFKNYTMGGGGWTRKQAYNELKKYIEEYTGLKIETSDKPIVIPQFPLGARLGNQLFTVAACYAHCLKNNYVMRYIPENPILNKIIGDKFISPYKVETKNLSTYKEPTYSYTEIPNSTSGYITGYFQSSKYFAEYKKEICDLYKRLISPEKKKNIAAIHIRMGDYLVYSDRYKSPKKDFIEKALAQLSPYIKRLMVFSDEPNKAMELIRSCNGSEKYGIINGSAESNEINDIRKMTACEELIMSCSSFSWWVAYLGEYKKVIVDKKWYNDNELSEKDIYEDSWIKI